MVAERPIGPSARRQRRPVILVDKGAQGWGLEGQKDQPLVQRDLQKVRCTIAHQPLDRQVVENLAYGDTISVGTDEPRHLPDVFEGLGTVHLVDGAYPALLLGDALRQGRLVAESLVLAQKVDHVEPEAVDTPLEP